MSSLLPDLVRAFAGLSLVAVGGANAAVPEIRHIVVDQHHWMADTSFSHLFANSMGAKLRPSTVFPPGSGHGERWRWVELGLSRATGYVAPCQDAGVRDEGVMPVWEAER